MLRLSLGVLLLSLFTACISPTPNVPSDIIQEAQMKEILVDIYTVEGILQATDRIKPEDMPVAKAYYGQVLKKHGVSQEQFNTSIKWYSAHHLVFEKVHDQVLEELSTRQSQLSGKS